MWNEIINLTMSTFGSDEGLLSKRQSIKKWILDAGKQ